MQGKLECREGHYGASTPVCTPYLQDATGWLYSKLPYWEGWEKLNPPLYTALKPWSLYEDANWVLLAE